MKPNDHDPALEHAIARLCADAGTTYVRDADALAIHLVAGFDVPEDVLRAIRESWGAGPTEPEAGPADDEGRDRKAA